MKSELMYERYAHGELPGGIQAEDNERIQALKQADTAFLERYPPETFLRDLENKHNRAGSIRFGQIFSAIAACLVLAIIVPSFVRNGDVTRLKGGDLRLFAYLKTEKGAELLKSESELKNGDEIQLAYFSRDKAYAVILSLDGRETITRLLPLDGNAASETCGNAIQVLPYSYRLDDAPNFEDIYLIVSENPFNVDAVISFVEHFFENGDSEPVVPESFRYIRLRLAKGVSEK